MIIIELIFNLSLLVAVSVLSGFLIKRWKRDSAMNITLQGFLFGAVALLGMINPFVLTEGIIFDGRSIVISLCALFFGPIAGLITTAIALGYRIYYGGAGIITGCSVILTSYIIGTIYYYWIKRRKIALKLYELYIFGIIVHLVMISLMVATPSDIRLIILKNMSFTILAIYPSATVLLGKIMKDQEENALLLKKLSTRERQFRSLVTNMSQGLAVHEIICNTEGKAIDYRFIYVNEKYELITGFKKEDILGKTVLEILPKTSIRTIQKYGEVALTGIPFHFVSYSRERKIYFEADIYQPVENQFAVILSDISARKITEQEIVSKNKMLEKLIIEKDKLFSIISHDMQSPMNGIIGLTSMLKDENESFSREHIKEIATSMHTSAKSISQLVHGLLEWSKLQRGNIKFEPVILPLCDSVLKCIDLLKETAKSKNISIHNNISNNHYVIADKQMLESVIRNILSNGIKFTPQWGTIHISISENNTKNITVAIKDSGIGMNQAILSQLFSLSAKTNRKGTEGELSSGLGLILCKELIEKHEGKIWVESEENKGSTFFFTLKSTEFVKETITTTSLLETFSNS